MVSSPARIGGTHSVRLDRAYRPACLPSRWERNSYLWSPTRGEQVSPGQLRVTFAAPAFNGQPAKTYVRNFVGQIPQDARRVVFHDAEYDGPKRGHYRPDHLTWHWDNIQIFTDNGTTSPPTTTTLPPTTTTTTTTLPPTTTTTPTTLPPTTTTTVVPTVPVVCTEIKVVVKPDNDGVNKILSMDSNEVTCP